MSRPGPSQAGEGTEVAVDPPGSDLDAGSGSATTPAGHESFPTIAERMARWWARTEARWGEDPGRVAEGFLSLLAVGVTTALVLGTLHPGDLWRDTTPTGGDMGAHVWGPRYLLDHLLPDLRLSGWTPDWYNGFPAYQFYMVVPSLLIVALHVGLPWWAMVPALLLAAGAALLAWSWRRLYPYRFVVLGAAVLTAVLAVGLPYNRSFKLVTAVGLLTLPLACWAFARLADLPFPAPPLAAGAGLLFLYNREPLYNNTGNIIGGNFQSTMAGEFAFSISLTLSVLYLGVAARGLRTGRHRALAAGLFALAGLCHLIPAFFVLACTAALFLLHPEKARLKWLATMVPVAGLLSAFWVLPFWWRRDHVNDMGWERLPTPNLTGADADKSSVWYYLLPDGLRALLVVALVGVVVSILRRYAVGLVLAMAWAAVVVAFELLPQGRLWNARLLPFMYLSVALLAAIAVAEVLRVLASLLTGRASRPSRLVTVGGATVVLAGVLVYTALPLSGLFDGIVTREAVTVEVEATGSTEEGAPPTTETKTRSSFWRFSTTAVNPVAGWSGWNYAGLERKEPTPAGCREDGATPCTSGGWPEYQHLVATMAGLGEDPDHGCGRTFWEYDGDRINGYGTPMAPMLLPYWTDGCIGSQEGLYFESSTTVPHHFLLQAQLSARPSQPQRELPYPSFDLDAGVRNLQLFGVRYYLAVSATAVSAASQHPDLTEVAVSGPWHVYEVADAPAVEALDREPVVVTGIDHSQHGWLPTMSAWLLAEDRGTFLVADGPAGWERVEAHPVPEEWRRLVRWMRDGMSLGGPMDVVPDAQGEDLPEVEVTGIRQERDRIRFEVSRPGVPVLVKTTYFPNWEASGAQGPYRVSPSFMVVVPTDREVVLTYGRTPVDLVALGLSLLGLVGLVVLARMGPVTVDPERPTAASAWIDRTVSWAEQPAPTTAWSPPWAPPPPDGTPPRGDPASTLPPAPDGAAGTPPVRAVETPPGPATVDPDEDDIWVPDPTPGDTER